MSENNKSKEHRRDEEHNTIIANRRGTDMEPNEPFDVETEPIRVKEQPYNDKEDKSENK